MSKFHVGDEICLSPCIDEYIKKYYNFFFSIENNKWDKIRGKTFIVTSVVGKTNYNGFTSNCAIKFDSGTSVGCFPEEVFEKVMKDLFMNEEDFIL